MSDDSVSQARKTLLELQAALGSIQESGTVSLVEALRRLSDALAGIEAMEARLAVQQSLLDDRLLRIETNRVFSIWSWIVRRGLTWSWIARDLLRRSPLRRVIEGGEEGSSVDAQYAVWLAHEQAALPEVKQARIASESWPNQPRISVLLAVRSREGFMASLSSIQNQVYLNWELCLGVDQGHTSWALPLLQQVDAGSGRIQHVTTADELDAASALNAVAQSARGDYLVFLEEGDLLSPFALYYMVESLNGGTFDLLYSDEDQLDSEGRRFGPTFKPDWSPDLLTSCMYLANSLTVSRQRFIELGGFRPDYSTVRLHDLALRLADQPSRVDHIARVLYHKRANRFPDDRSSSDDATVRTIKDAISRSEGLSSVCVPGPASHTFLVRRILNQPAEMAAIICSKSPHLLAKCLESLRSTASSALREIIVVAHEESGPNASLRELVGASGATLVPFGGAFNFSTMSNLGAAAATAPYFLFLNDDVTATGPGWADLLVQQVTRERVGVAGAVLWYPYGALQHAGIAVGCTGGVGHMGRFMRSSELWPWLLVTRNVSAVTGACMAIRGELFRSVGGFDSDFSVNYNDVDLCFRVRALGLDIVCVPVPGLIHAECQSRRGIVRFEERYKFHRRWGSVLARPDPFYSPSLAPTEMIALNLGDAPDFQRLLAGKALEPFPPDGT